MKFELTPIPEGMEFELTHIPEGMAVELLALTPPDGVGSETTTELLVGVSTEDPKLRFMFSLTTGKDEEENTSRVNVLAAYRQVWTAASNCDSGLHGWQNTGSSKDSSELPWNWFKDEHYLTALHLSALYTVQVLSLIENAGVLGFSTLSLTCSAHHTQYTIDLFKEACRNQSYSDMRLSKYGDHFHNAMDHHAHNIDIWSYQFGVLSGRSACDDDVKGAIAKGEEGLETALKVTHAIVKKAAEGAVTRTLN